MIRMLRFNLNTSWNFMQRAIRLLTMYMIFPAIHATITNNCLLSTLAYTESSALESLRRASREKEGKL